MIRKRVIARGRVQGVFFRDSVRRRAQAAGVAGWATNRDDGAVETVLEGEADAVESLVRFIREGPGEATVESVEVSEGEQPEGLAGFEIR